MNKWWPQQGVFVDRIKEFCKKQGLLTKRGAPNYDILADMFNLNEDVLKQVVYDKTRKRPHLNTLTHIASVIECSVTEFLDAPSDPPPGLSLERWAALSDRERAIAVSMFAGIESEELSVEEKELLHFHFQALKDSLLQLKKRG